MKLPDPGHNSQTKLTPVLGIMNFTNNHEQLQPSPVVTLPPIATLNLPDLMCDTHNSLTPLPLHLPAQPLFVPQRHPKSHHRRGYSSSVSGREQEQVKNKFVDPYKLSELLSANIDAVIPTRCWFRYCLRSFELSPGDYFSTVKNVKYAMWLYFTAKQGVFLRQMRSRGIRVLNEEEREISPSEQSSGDPAQSASFSYSCKNCKKVIFVAKKKLSRSYNDGVNNNAPTNMWVIRTISMHPFEECREMARSIRPTSIDSNFSSSPSPTSVNEVKLNCPHTLDLIRTINDRVTSRSEDLRREAVFILQDIYFGKVYDENTGTLSKINNNNEKLSIQVSQNPTKSEVSYIKRRQELMARMVKRRVYVVGRGTYKPKLRSDLISIS